MISFLNYSRIATGIADSITFYLGPSAELPPEDELTMALYFVHPGIYKGKLKYIDSGEEIRQRDVKIHYIRNGRGSFYPEIFFRYKRQVEDFIKRYGKVSRSEFSRAKSVGEALEFPDTKFRMY